MNWASLLQLAPEFLAGMLVTALVVIWLIALGKLVPGKTHDDVRKDRDWYRERYNDGEAMREDRDWYRDRLARSTDILGTLLSTVEVEETDR